MVRRIIFIAIVFLLEDHLAIQIMLFILTNILYIIYTIISHPLYHYTKFDIFNELCTILISYLLIVYTDFVDSIDIKYTTGFYIISIIGMNILVQCFLILKETYHQVKLHLKMMYYRCKYGKLLNGMTTEDQLKASDEEPIEDFNLRVEDYSP